MVTSRSHVHKGFCWQILSHYANPLSEIVKKLSLELLLAFITLPDTGTTNQRGITATTAVPKTMTAPPTTQTQSAAPETTGNESSHSKGNIVFSLQKIDHIFERKIIANEPGQKLFFTYR